MRGPLPYRPERQPFGATISVDVRATEDWLRVEIDSEAYRVEWVVPVQSSGVEVAPGGAVAPGGGLSIGLGVGTRGSSGSSYAIGSGWAWASGAVAPRRPRPPRSGWTCPVRRRGGSG